MSQVRFPSVEAIRSALRQLKPDPYELFNATGIRHHWLFRFTSQKRDYSAAAYYESMAKLIPYLESRGVVFTSEDTFELRFSEVAA